jgi:hypothetical protein
LYREELTDPSGKKYNTKEHSITEVMNSKAMEDLRKQFLDGKKPSSCNSCWKEEAVGKTSKRQHMWYKAPSIRGIAHKQKHCCTKVYRFKTRKHM